MYVTVTIEIADGDTRREDTCTIGEEDEDRAADFKPFVLDEACTSALTTALYAAGALEVKVREP